MLSLPFDSIMSKTTAQYESQVLNRFSRIPPFENIFALIFSFSHPSAIILNCLHVLYYNTILWWSLSFPFSNGFIIRTVFITTGLKSAITRSHRVYTHGIQGIAADVLHPIYIDKIEPESWIHAQLLLFSCQLIISHPSGHI